MHLLKEIKLTKDMGHELFENIRAGNWLIDYTVDRIRKYTQQEPSIGLQKCVQFLEQYMECVKKLPAHMKPKYASRVIETLHNAIIKEII